MNGGEWNDFVEKCFTLESKKELAIFFDLVLTATERDELPKRLKILQELLRNEKTQREIAKDLKVSIANVTRGANELKSSPPWLNVEKILL